MNQTCEDSTQYKRLFYKCTCTYSRLVYIQVFMYKVRGINVCHNVHVPFQESSQNRTKSLVVQLDRQIWLVKVDESGPIDSIT